MTCASCVRHVEQAARGVAGVGRVDVNLARGLARLRVDDGDPQAVGRAAAEAIRAAGYPAAVEAGGGNSEDERLQRQRRHAEAWKRRAVIGGALWLPVEATHWGLALAGVHAAWMPWVALVAATLAVIFVGRAFFANAFAAARRGTTDMDTLISLGAGTAYGYSLVAFGGGLLDLWPTPHLYFMEAAGLLALISLGHWLEARARDRAGSAIRELVSLTPAEATLEDGTTKRQDELEVGDRVRVRPGERVPADGIVEAGRSGVDESLVTGESIPVPRGVGDEVIGGSLVSDGRLTVRLTRVGDETALAQIVRLVEAAQASKPPVQRLADRISAVFVPAVLAIAVLTLIGWVVYGLATDMPTAALAGRAANAVCSVLIIACPCALGLAVPAALMVGTGAGARRGVLLRDVDALQHAREVKVVAFDKTGTLTLGRPEVTHVEGGDDVLRLAAAAERFSAHPLAKAVVAEAQARGLDVPEPEDFEDVPGLGVTATLGGRKLVVGSAALLAEHGIDAADPAATAVHVAADGRHLGHVELTDALRPESRRAVEAVRALGLPVVLVTGDRASAARPVAEALGIDDVRAEVRPGGKAEVVRELRRRYGPVAMVGDGVNDAPALAEADLGVALGGGSDVAAETGGVVLTAGNPLGVAAAIRLSRGTMRVIRQNLFFAFVYNVVAIPFAAFGLLNPLIAAACMALSDVTVLGNALRLRRFGRSGG